MYGSKAASLQPGDRYQSGYDHGFADEKSGQPEFCSSDHTSIYCNGCDTGYNDAQAGHYHENS